MNYGQGEKYTVVAGQTIVQYAPVTVTGSYASGSDFYGINQDKPIAGDHFAAVVKGETKARFATACSVGDFVSVTGSGYLAPMARCELRRLRRRSGGLPSRFRRDRLCRSLRRTAVLFRAVARR